MNDSWETPDDLWKKCDQIWQFDVDVCADESNRKHWRYFTKEMDGLAQDWKNYTCWCNPPYSDPEPWVKRAHGASYCGARVVMLLPVDTSTKWFREIYQHADEIVFLTPRVRFVGAPGSPRWANMLVVWEPVVPGFSRTRPVVHHWRWTEGEIVDEAGGGAEDEDGVEATA